MAKVAFENARKKYGDVITFKEERTGDSENWTVKTIYYCKVCGEKLFTVTQDFCYSYGSGPTLGKKFIEHNYPKCDPAQLDLDYVVFSHLRWEHPELLSQTDKKDKIEKMW